MKKHLLCSCTILLFLIFLCSGGVRGNQSVIYSRHNLSVTGPGLIKATIEQPVCAFCHTPHREGQARPLWQASSRAIYTTYESSTLEAEVGQPNGVSRLCLACHDGTIALGMRQGDATPISFRGGMNRIPSGPANLGLDLSDDHPISFVYDSALAARNGQLAYPTSLRGTPVTLDIRDQLQCTSCHTPHDDQYGKFLVMDNRFSALCTTCHVIDFWSMTSHRSSMATWNQGSPDPWPHTSYTTVASNGCENCHRPHSAGGGERLMNFDFEEDNCFACHNGNVAAKDIEREFNKPFRHPIRQTKGIHDPTEDPLWSTRHVECEDCHNPHAANGTPARPPLASGSLAQVVGISSSGTPVEPLTFEYELCYRCHSDNPGNESPVVSRYIFEMNVRLEFAPSNLSYHPIESFGKNRDVPSLIPSLTVTSRIGCTDCHNSDSGDRIDGPRGPHGSVWRPILERQLAVTDLTAENPQAYALCYKCHNRNNILTDQSFPEHRRHVVEERAPCSVCHDPHGVAPTTHLINFDKTIVFPNDRGDLHFEDYGRVSGACSLKCHGENHDLRSYP